MKKILCLLLTVVLVIGASGCKKRSYEYLDDRIELDGLTIVLTEGFYILDGEEGYDAVYVSDDSAVYIRRLTCADYPELADKSPAEVAELVYEAVSENAVSIQAPQQTEKMVSLRYDYDGLFRKNAVATCLSCIYEGAECFWIIDFCCMKEDYEELAEHIRRWAESVKPA